MPRSVGKTTILRTRATRVLLLALDGGSAGEQLAAAPGFELVTAISFAEAMLAVVETRPAAVVAALAHPEASDAEALKQLVTRADAAPVLVITHPVSTERAVELIKAGAGGYLFTPDARYLATSVRELLRGGVPMSEPISRLVMQRARKSSAKLAAVRLGDPSASDLLTERQREILKFLQHGHSYGDIGVALGLSVNTVRSHVRTIYERLGAATKVEAVMVAMELGIIDRTNISERPPPNTDS